MKTPLLEGEIVLRHGFANLFRGIEAVGGHLVLTTRRLVFESHRVNIQRGATVLELADIREVRLRRTLGVVPNGLDVRGADGTSFQFVVRRREEWLSALSAAQGQPAPS